MTDDNQSTPPIHIAPNDDRPVLMRAIDIAFPIIEADLNTPDIIAVLVADGADPARVLAHAFLGAMERVHDKPRNLPQLFACGWCVAAAGDTDDAWRAVPKMDGAAIKAHTLICEHNPLVVAIRVAISAHDNCRYLWGPTPKLNDALEALRSMVTALDGGARP